MLEAVRPPAQFSVCVTVAQETFYHIKKEETVIEIYMLLLLTLSWVRSLSIFLSVTGSESTSPL